MSHDLTSSWRSYGSISSDMNHDLTSSGMSYGSISSDMSHDLTFSGRSYGSISSDMSHESWSNLSRKVVMSLTLHVLQPENAGPIMPTSGGSHPSWRSCPMPMLQKGDHFYEMQWQLMVTIIKLSWICNLLNNEFYHTTFFYHFVYYIKDPISFHLKWTVFVLKEKLLKPKISLWLPVQQDPCPDTWLRVSLPLTNVQTREQPRRTRPVASMWSRRTLTCHRRACPDKPCPLCCPYFAPWHQKIMHRSAKLHTPPNAVDLLWSCEGLWMGYFFSVF